MRGRQCSRPITLTRGEAWKRSVFVRVLWCVAMRWTAHQIPIDHRHHSLFSATSCHCVCVPTEAGSSYARTNLIFGFEVNEDGSLAVIPVTLNVKLHVIRITGFYGFCRLRRVARVLAVAIWRCAYLIMTEELVTHRVRTQTFQSCAIRYSFKLITQSKRVLVT